MNKKGQFDIFIGMVVVIGIIFVIGLFFIGIVNFDEYCFVKSFSGKLDNGIKTQGFTWKGFFGGLKCVNNQHRNHEILIDAPSKDLQKILIDLNINMKIKQDKAYDFIVNYPSEDTYTQYLNNKIQERIKITALKYNAEDFIYKRPEISKEILTEVQNIPEINYFEIGDVAVKNIEYSEGFRGMLERKAQIELESQIIQKQKANIKLIQENMQNVDMDDYFKYIISEKWDGKSSLTFISNNYANATK